jgi:hypothetical protein
MSDAAAAVARPCSAQAERTRTGLLLGHCFLRIYFYNFILYLPPVSLIFIHFGFIFILSIWDTGNDQ